MIKERDLRIIAGDLFSDIKSFEDLKEFIIKIGELKDDKDYVDRNHQIAELIIEKDFGSQSELEDYIKKNGSVEYRYLEEKFKPEWEEGEVGCVND